MRLLVVADDFGVNEPRSRGIISAMKDGVVTSISLIVNGACAVAMLELAKQELPELSAQQVGLHINLTEGKALAGASGLTDSEGCFLGKMGLRGLDRIDPTDVEKELAAQVAFIDTLSHRLFGETIRHYDGHNHFHTDPQLRDLVAQLMSGSGFVSTRCPACLTVTPYLHEYGRITSQRLFHERVAAEAAEAAPTFSKHGLRTPDAFFGLALLEDCSTSVLLDTLARLPALVNTPDAIVEVMTHVGHTYCDTPVPDPMSYHYDGFSTSPRRQAELDMWRSQKVREALQAFGKASFGDL